MSDTPETDAIAHAGWGADSYIAQMTDKARSLERERDFARTEIADRTKRIEGLVNALNERTAECLEQATTIGKGAEREMALMAKLEWVRFELMKVQTELRKVTNQ
jgi:hypothetical protein